MKRIFSFLLILTFLPLASVFADSPLSIPQIDCSAASDEAVLIGTTVHFSISVTGAEQVQLMIVDPDSNISRADGTEIDCTLNVPGIWAFVAYAADASGKKVKSDQLRIEVLDPAQHEHFYDVYYDDSLQEHTYCIFCEPRTEEQKLEDAINAERYYQRFAAEVNASAVFSLNDRAGWELETLVKVHLDPLTKVGSAFYLLGSFSWIDLIKTQIPGSEEVNKIRRQAVQDAIQQVLQSKPIEDASSDDWGIPVDQMEELTSLLYDIIDWASENSEELSAIRYELKDLKQIAKFIVNGWRQNNKVSFQYGLFRLGEVKDELKYVSSKLLTPDKARFIDAFIDEFQSGWALNLVFFIIDTGLDMAEYDQMSAQRKEIVNLALQRMVTNIRILDDIQNTFADDQDISAACTEFKSLICAYAANDLLGDVLSMSIDQLNTMKIVLTNARDAGAEITLGSAISAAFVHLCGAAGSLVTIAGAGTGLIAEIIWGVHTGYMSYDYIANLYSDMDQFINQHEKNMSSWPDHVKAFASIYIIELKISGLELAKKIFDKGDHADMIEMYNTSIRLLRDCIEDIINGYLPN